MTDTNPFISGYGRPNSYNHSNPWAVMSPCYDNDGDGGGSGGDDGGDGGSGDGDGDGGGEGDGDGSGDGEAAATKIKAHTFKDENGQVLLPGHKTPVSVKDLAAAVQARTQYTQGMKILGQIAQAFKQRQGGQGQGQGRGQGHGQGQGDALRRRASDKQDAFAALEKLELVEGPQLAQHLRQIYGQQLDPVLKAVPALVQEVKNLRERLGVHDGNRETAALSGAFNQVISSLKLPSGDNGQPVPGADVMQELVNDFYFSFEDAEQKKLTPEMFSQMFGDRFKKMRTFFRELEKAELVSAQKRARQKLFARPGAGSSANGKPQPPTNRRDQIRNAANILFANQPST